MAAPGMLRCTETGLPISFVVFKLNCNKKALPETSKRRPVTLKLWQSSNEDMRERRALQLETLAKRKNPGHDKQPGFNGNHPAENQAELA
jgi:hypothetical protein